MIYLWAVILLLAIAWGVRQARIELRQEREALLGDPDVDNVVPLRTRARRRR